MLSNKVKEDYDSPDEFQEYLEELHTNRGLTQIATGRKMGIERSDTFNRFVRGKSTTSYEKFRLLREGLKLTDQEWNKLLELALFYTRLRERSLEEVKQVEERVAKEIKQAEREAVKEKCFGLVSTEIQKLLEFPHAKLLLRALAKSIIKVEDLPKEFEGQEDSAEDIAKFIVDLHQGENSQSVDETLNGLFALAIREFTPSTGELYSELQKDDSMTNKGMEKLFYS